MQDDGGSANGLMVAAEEDRSVLGFQVSSVLAVQLVRGGRGLEGGYGQRQGWLRPYEEEY